MRQVDGFSLLHHNTFGLNVRCRTFIEYDTVDELESIVRSGNLSRSKWFHLGGGSNLLFLNDYYDGIVLHSGIKGIELFDEGGDSVLARVGAGVVWDEFVEWCVARGFGGVENLSLIPGEVGASPVQNIGAYGTEAKDVIHRVEAMGVNDALRREFTNEDCNFSYRNSFFKKNGIYIVAYVTFRLKRESAYTYNLEYGNIKKALEGETLVNLSSIRKSILAVRSAKLPDPKEIGSAGSFFKNPVVPVAVYDRMLNEYPNMPSYEVAAEERKIPAGWLIEQCGWKGKNLGHAGVYEKQALVLVNRGGASGKEIWSLAKEIIESVKARFGIEIFPEVCVVG